MTYQEALAYISGLEARGWRLGLDRMQAFVERLGLGHAIGPGTPRYLHVAGTNGKGSVTAFLQSLLVAHGYRTGAFFSPFVVDPRERVQFGREMISQEELASIVTELAPIAESFSETPFGGISEFEFKTAVALRFWQLQRAEYVALEVGLGGRLDATNVVTPACSAVVTIGLDHTNILGETLEEIAAEKGGVIKPGIPVVLGEMPSRATQVLEAIARERGAPVHRPDARAVGGLPLGLRGRRQPHNAAIALAMLEAAGRPLEPQAVAEGLRLARLPGRFEVRIYQGITFVFDGAHNADAAAELAANLRAAGFGSCVLVTNMVTGHDARSFYEPLAGSCRVAHVAPIDSPRAVDPFAMAQALTPLIVATPHDGVEQALLAAMSDVGSGECVLVTGSFYLVGAAIRWLEAQPA